MKPCVGNYLLKSRLLKQQIEKTPSAAGTVLAIERFLTPEEPIPESSIWIAPPGCGHLQPWLCVNQNGPEAEEARLLWAAIATTMPRDNQGFMSQS